MEQNNTHQLEQLLAYTPSFRSPELTALLQIAVLKKCDQYAPCVKVLLDKGANPDGISGDGTPFLVLAADGECSEILRLLLEAGCGVNQPRASDGATALHRAAWYGQLGMVRKLLAGGADSDIRDAQDRTALVMAAQGDELEVVEMLLGQCDVDARDCEGNSALHWAVAHGNEEMVQTLIAGGVNLDLQNEEGNSALMLSAGMGQLKMLHILLNNGSDANLLNAEGSNALLLAAKEGQRSCCHALILAGCDVNVRDDSGATPIVYLFNDVELLELLLGYGADPNIVTCDGQTPLSLAVVSSNSSAVKILLKANAVLHFQEGKHIIQTALYEAKMQLTKILYHSADVNGENLNWLRDYLEDPNLNAHTRDNPAVGETVEWLRQQLQSKELNLQHLCRASIRQHLGSVHFRAKLKSLPLPKSMISFIDNSRNDS